MKWTSEQLQLLRQEYPGADDMRGLAARLGKPVKTVRAQAKNLGLRRQHYQMWSAEEEAILRQSYGKIPAPDLAARLGRPVGAVHRAAWARGLGRQYNLGPPDLDKLRRLNAEGLTDTEIGARLGRDRHIISFWRGPRKLDLPSNAYGQQWRDRIRAGALRQCARAGVANMGQLRAKSYSDFARENGWPDDLRPRAVQILNVLAAAGGPLDRRQIAELVGMPWKGSRKSLVSNDPEGSYLAHLVARQLVTCLYRALPVRGQGKGYSRNLYCLGPAALAILTERARIQQAKESTHEAQP